MLRNESPPTLVTFVDGERARLTAFLADGRGGDITIEHEIEGCHRHRERHDAAVAEALARFTLEWGIERIVLVGEPRAVARLRDAVESAA